MRQHTTAVDSDAQVGYRERREGDDIEGTMGRTTRLAAGSDGTRVPGVAPAYDGSTAKGRTNRHIVNGVTTGAGESNGESSLVSALREARSSRDRCGGYLVEWAEGSSFAPTLPEAEAEAMQVAKTWQATVWRVGRDGDRDRVVSVQAGAGTGDVVVVQFGGAAERMAA